VEPFSIDLPPYKPEDVLEKHFLILYTKQIYKNSIKKDSGNTFFILKRTKSSQIRLVEFPRG
jgi:hypothetical protein